MSLPLVVAGMSLGQQMLGQYYNNRDARRYERSIQRRRTSPEGIRLQEALTRYKQMADTLPAQLEASLTSQAQTASAARRSRMNRAFMRMGKAGGSEAMMRAERGTLADLNNQRSDIGFRTASLGAQMQSSLANMNLAADQYLNPADNRESTYIDPFSAINAGVMANMWQGRNAAPGVSANAASGSLLGSPSMPLYDYAIPYQPPQTMYQFGR